MSKAKLKEIADVIREKDGTTESIIANDFANKIKALPSGKYNIEVIQNTDKNGKITQTLNITDWDYVPAPSFDPVFANNSWTQIAQASQIIKDNNYTSAQVKEIFGWDLQTDTKVDIGVDGVSRTIGMLGFNHDDCINEAGFYGGKAGISFQTIDCEPTKYDMNYDEQRETNGGYAMSKFVSDSYTLFECLSDELKSVIKPAFKLYANGGRDYYEFTEELPCSIFLFSEIEIFGTVINAQAGETEGTQYEYWIGKSDVDRIKNWDRYGTGVPDTATSWFLRSCYKDSNTSYVIVRNDGTSNKSTSTSAQGISFGFCI